MALRHGLLSWVVESCDPLHRSQIRESLWKAHLEAEEQKKMAQLDENENEDFKNRINPPGVYQAHRDSEGLRKCKSRTLIYNKKK